MEFQVPQFIEVEDKIFGPLTFKQFVYVVGGAGMCFALYTFLPFLVAVLFIVPIAVFSLMLAFYKLNNRAFIFTVEAAFKYVMNEKLYIWKKIPKKEEEPKKPEELGTEDSLSSLYVPKLSDSKLKDLTWSLDVHKNIK